MTSSMTYRLLRDAGIVLASVVFAVWVVRSGVVDRLLSSVSGLDIIGSFIAGFFFTSFFTVAPATVVLAQIATSHSIILVALVGGAGALLGDFVIFYFIRDYIAEDLMRATGRLRVAHLFHLRFFRWLVMALGVLIIASPLPDELGLSLLGISKTKTSLFVCFSFFANAAGIAFIGVVARAL